MAESRYNLEQQSDSNVSHLDTQLMADQGLAGSAAAPPIDALASGQDLEASGTGNLVCQDGTNYDSTGGRLPGNEEDGAAVSASTDQVARVVPVAPGSLAPGVEITSGTEPAAQVGEGTAVPAGVAVSMQATSTPRQCKHILVIPYTPGIGHKLQKIARNYNFDTWLTFPGNKSDLFMRHHGKHHRSKLQNSVYCVQCTCGLQYVGELARNLKVRLNEHFHDTSCSSLSNHMKDQNHKPTMHDTTIIAHEKNCLKRKVLESLCIKHKHARLCNTGVSMDIPAIWQLCAEEMSRQLNDMD